MLRERDFLFFLGERDELRKGILDDRTCETKDMERFGDVLGLEGIVFN